MVTRCGVDNFDPVYDIRLKEYRPNGSKECVHVSNSDIRDLTQCALFLMPIDFDAVINWRQPVRDSVAILGYYSTNVNTRIIGMCRCRASGNSCLPPHPLRQPPHA